MTNQKKLQEKKLLGVLQKGDLGNVRANFSKNIKRPYKAYYI